MPTASPPIDSHVQVVTPENIAFEYRVAGPFGRVMAYLIDMAILIVTFTVSSILISIAFSVIGLAGVGASYALVSFFALFWFYGGLFEAFWNGQTPGKKAMGLRVLRIDGRPITGFQAVLRNLLRYFDAFSWVSIPGFFFGYFPLVFPTFLLALLLMPLTKRFQRAGDLAVGTMVVAEDRSRFGKVPAPDEPGLLELLDKIPTSFTPSRTLAKTLSHYIGRRRFFSPARRQEIAKHVGAVIAKKLQLPPSPDTDYDLLLCALYLRAFHDSEVLEGTDDKIAPRVPIPDSTPTPSSSPATT